MLPLHSTSLTNCEDATMVLPLSHDAYAIVTQRMHQDRTAVGGSKGSPIAIGIFKRMHRGKDSDAIIIQHMRQVGTKR